MLSSTLKEVGLIDAESQQAALMITQFRSPQRKDYEEDFGVVGGLKHAPFEDVAELHDLRRLQTIPLRILSQHYSVQQGISTSRTVGENALPSSFYTIQTALFDDTGWAKEVQSSQLDWAAVPFG